MIRISRADAQIIARAMLILLECDYFNITRNDTRRIIAAIEQLEKHYTNRMPVRQANTIVQAQRIKQKLTRKLQKLCNQTK
jgi:hypothetical protein